MSFYAKIILDSINPTGQRLTTMEVCYPRFIHSEIMTHRDRARNAASSRAIPFPVMCERINYDPVIPIQWPSEQKGMQGGDEIPTDLRPLARAIWLAAMNDAMKHANALHNIGQTGSLINVNMPVEYYNELSPDERRSLDVFFEESPPSALKHKIHKSIPNRIVEPWMWITVVMTATEWKNFFRLRCHKDAEVHFQKIAGLMRFALERGEPDLLQAGEWHRPYIRNDDQPDLLSMGYEPTTVSDPLNRISTARCARISYLNQAGIRDIEDDLTLFERLCEGSGFGHWSAHEHVNQSAGPEARSGPFRGWSQFRKEFPLENVEG